MQARYLIHVGQMARYRNTHHLEVLRPMILGVMVVQRNHEAHRRSRSRGHRHGGALAQPGQGCFLGQRLGPAV